MCYASDMICLFFLQLLLLMQDHTRIALAVDNAKLAADDFRTK